MKRLALAPPPIRRSNGCRYLQCRRFADRPALASLPAVVLDADGLDDETMQAIARWTRVAGNHDVLPPVSPEASYGIRIFSLRREVPFAGHPSVGTAHAVLEAGIAAPRDGLLVQEASPGCCRCAFPAKASNARSRCAPPKARVLEVALGRCSRATCSSGLLPLGTPPTGADGWRTPLVAGRSRRGEPARRSPDWEAIERLANATDSMGLCVFARSDDPVYYLAVAPWSAPARFEDARPGRGERDVGRAGSRIGMRCRATAASTASARPRGRPRRDHRTHRRCERRCLVRRPRMQRGARGDRLALMYFFSRVRGEGCRKGG